jgi:hypothetical protein
MQIATLVVASLAFATSATTLAIVIVGGKRAKDEVEAQVEDVKRKTNSAIHDIAESLRTFSL